MRTLSPLLLLFAVACSAPRSIPRAAIALDDIPAVPATAPTARDERTASFGAEVRGYPAGVILGMYGEGPLSEHDVLTFALGANLTDRRDWGEHDNEDGDGFGGGIGYRHYYGEELDRWFLGGRVDLWSLSIDWRDSGSRSGTTDVIVLQPTVEGGYGFLLGNGWRLNVFVAFGAEINVHTDGEDVGDGGIGILGVSYHYGF